MIMSLEDNLTDPRHLHLSKHLETINFKEFAKRIETDKRENVPRMHRLLKKKSRVLPVNSKKPKTQIELFQKSMKLLLICGQFIGLNPVIAITNMDVSKMRFTVFSLRFVYSCTMFVCQAVSTSFPIYRLITKSISIKILAFVSFYAGACLTTFLFIRIASKWPSLMKKIANSSLDKYIDTSVQAKCMSITVIFLTLAVLEHLLSLNTKVMDSINCANENVSAYQKFIVLSFPWFKDLNFPLHPALGFVFNFVNIISTINWNYSDLFLVCMSVYLVSILEKINKIINEVDQRFYHPSFWLTIREDYTKAARLISSFDDVINGVMLVSFANNLFFICLQLFNVLSHGLDEKLTSIDPCIAYAFRGVFENFIYFVFSFIFVLGRFLTVSLVAASIHTASRVPAPVLYAVPSTAYCIEVQRFIEQIHGDHVALSGLKFFYITKGLVLTVAGTIVTYELVLLQFDGEV